MKSCLPSCPFPIFWDFLYLGTQIDHESDIPYMVNQSLTTITLHAETLYIIIKLINYKRFLIWNITRAPARTCQHQPFSATAGVQTSCHTDSQQKQ